jgi:hypothetical protein
MTEAILVGHPRRICNTSLTLLPAPHIHNHHRLVTVPMVPMELMVEVTPNILRVTMTMVHLADQMCHLHRPHMVEVTVIHEVHQVVGMVDLEAAMLDMVVQEGTLVVIRITGVMDTPKMTILEAAVVPIAEAEGEGINNYPNVYIYTCISCYYIGTSIETC